ncbi:MAG: hypothetical protein IPM18_17970 [Phycisphaerales bacterium]|nr:hypothetical protein [Phycisphaerales bacterium]
MRFETVWAYEADRDLVNAVTNTWYDSGGANPVTVSKHEYGFNARAPSVRTTSAAATGIPLRSTRPTGIMTAGS